MILRIDNKTNYLNDYHFQTLCMLYFPGEKFPPNVTEAENEAYFSVEIVEINGKRGCKALSFLRSGARTAKAERCLFTDSFSFEADLAFTVQATVGKSFLDAGRQLFGFTPPWGYLTGLRPVKRSRFHLEQGLSPDQVYDMFTKDYCVSEEKAKLSLDIAATEERMLLDYSAENDCCLYIAIPFCPTRCEYCSFVSYSNDKLFKTIPDYLERLHGDIKRTAEIVKRTGFDLKAIYVGGGTPSILADKQIEELLGLVNNSFDMSKVREFSFESGRPDTTTLSKLKLVKSMGVNRVSINPQTTDDSVLKRIGRNHSAKQFFDAADMAMTVGFSGINADLIAGLPGDTFDGFCKSIEDVINCGFNNITVHTLSVKNAAPIRFDESGIYDAAGDNARRCVSYAQQRLAEAGQMPYYLYRQKNTIGNAENTGYAVQGRECAYNVLMMEETNTVFACGASSITKLVSPDGSKIERIAFPKYPFEYLSAPQGIGEDKIVDFFKGRL